MFRTVPALALGPEATRQQDHQPDVLTDIGRAERAEAWDWRWHLCRAETQPQPGSDCKTTRPGVLVVDDDPEIRELLIVALEAQDYTVRWATNGQEALQILVSWQPDAILLDPEMPVMDGRTFRAHQLNDLQLAAIPVLVLAANGYLCASGHQLDTGVLVPKPFNLQELLATLKVLIRGSVHRQR
jgi:CheY-like chemotaxis protein